jgi:hypothetical protein
MYQEEVMNNILEFGGETKIVWMTRKGVEEDKDENDDTFK